MLRTLRFVATFTGALFIIVIASPLLFWLGRAYEVRPPGELVVDDYDPDDPGEDVDGEDTYP